MLQTKLHIPSTCSNLVHRSNLFEKLNMGLERKLILISAPAGFGKTTVISDWIRESNITSAWYSIDKRDNDPKEFLCYIIAAVKNIDSDFGLSSQKLLNTPQKPNIESIAGLLINDILKIKNEFVLVLDDFHLINSMEVFEIVKFLLEHIPKQIHIIISTRSDPPLPIARLRSQNQLVELRSSDLSFSANDISIFFNKKLKFGLSIVDIYSLETKTEGWIAGLQLTVLSMQGRENISQFIENFAGDNRYIMDYLIEEVLNRQSEEVKDFLLKTSVLEQFSGELCGTILNISNSQLLLEFLDTNNMFIIPLDSQRHWYRYHHLFADLLKQRLLQEKKDEIKDIHNKASLWYEENDMYAYAIDHSLEAQNFEKAMILLNGIVEKLWRNGNHDAIMKFGSTMPINIIKAHPNFCLFYSWILISAGNMTKAEELLITAEKIVSEILINNESVEDQFEYKVLLGKISVAFAYLLSSTGKIDRIFHYCEQAKSNLSDEEPLWYSWVWFSFGVANITIGELEQGTRSFQKALKYGKKSENLYLIATTVIRIAYSKLRLGLFKSAYKNINELLTFVEKGGYSQMTKSEWTYAGLYSILAYIQFMWNEIDNAVKNAKIGYVLSKKGKDITLVVFNTIVYAKTLIKQGDSIVAAKIIDELDNMMQSKQIPYYLFLSLSAWKIDILINQNQIEKASGLIDNLDLGEDKKKTYANELIYIAYSRYLITIFELAEAKRILLQLLPPAIEGKRIERVIEINNLLAIQHKLVGESEKAISYLSEAIFLASDENLIMFFILEGDNILDLLKEIRQRISTSKSNIPKKFLDNILAAFELQENKKLLNSSESLSTREIDVLKLISDDYSNQGIAEKLFVSINTVKTHVKNIHLKLEVQSRSKAVIKAKELGLL